MRLNEACSVETCGAGGSKTKIDIFRNHGCPIFLGDQIAKLLGLKLQSLKGFDLDPSTHFKISTYETNKSDKFIFTQNGVLELARKVGTRRAKNFMNFFRSTIIPFTNDPKNIRRIAVPEHVLRGHVAEGDVQSVLQAFLAGSSMEAVDSRGQTFTYIATLFGKVKVVRLLLDLKADVNIACEQGWTPLMVAGLTGRVGVIEYILKCGGKMDMQSKEGSTALSFAIDARKTKAALFLIRSKADLSLIIGKANKTAFSLACEAGDLCVVKELLKYKADLTLGGDVDGACPALQTAVNDGNNRILQFLIDSNANVNAIQVAKTNWTAMHLCAHHGTKDTLKTLIQASADVNCKTDRGMSPLMLATLRDKHLDVRVLVNSGADIAAASSDCLTALDYAAYNGRLKCIQELGPYVDISNLQDVQLKLPIDVKNNLPEMMSCAKCGVRPVFGQKQHRKCSYCRVVRYCSRNCQVSDWVNHKCK